MENKSSKNLLFIALIAIALAIAYLGYQVSRFVDQIPYIKETIDNVDKRIPTIVSEVEQIRKQIPPILLEVEHVRSLIPSILEEVDQVRLTANAYEKRLPSITQSIDNISSAIDNGINQTVPHLPLIIETSNDAIKQVGQTTNAISNLEPQIPLILQRVDNVVAELPGIKSHTDTLMTRAETLVVEAKGIGAETSEGAVQGLFTGIIKAPKAIIQEISQPILSTSGNRINDNLDLEDLKIIGQSLKTAWQEGGSSGQYEWTNKKSGHKGTFKIKNKTQANGQTCYDTSFNTKLSGNLRSQKKTLHICQTSEGTFVLD